MNKSELRKKLEQATTDKEKLNIRGRLIVEIKKEIKKYKGKKGVEYIEAELNTELRNQKDLIVKMLKDKETKYKIPERVSLRVQEIKTIIELYTREKVFFYWEEIWQKNLKKKILQRKLKHQKKKLKR